MGKWIGVDFDGTLATYDGWQGTTLGAPIAPMVARVQNWLLEGKEVRIVTARVSTRNDVKEWDSDTHRKAIQDWCQFHVGWKLPVTAEKDFEMMELWDDRAVSVEMNTGKICDMRKTDKFVSIGKTITKHDTGCNDRPRTSRGCYCGADHQ